MSLCWFDALLEVVAEDGVAGGVLIFVSTQITGAVSIGVQGVERA